ncbi:hypothetical protein VP01_2929g1 [Puccinia sorghi]|uniref:Uncharacterized protein n=1 Tax=Puccinia sorghi TaxID=27349 RepID=A0A0L6V2Y2_9BASI|nr:hypothetical protein VP01_2929g1 [Puccinia sorghi]
MNLGKSTNLDCMSLHASVHVHVIDMCGGSMISTVGGQRGCVTSDQKVSCGSVSSIRCCYFCFLMLHTTFSHHQYKSPINHTYYITNNTHNIQQSPHKINHMYMCSGSSERSAMALFNVRSRIYRSRMVVVGIISLKVPLLSCFVKHGVVVFYLYYNAKSTSQSRRTDGCDEIGYIYNLDVQQVISKGCTDRDLNRRHGVYRIRKEEVAWIEGVCLHWNWNEGRTRSGKHFVLTRIGTEEGSCLGNFFLNQERNSGLTTTGKNFVLTRNGMKVRTTYRGKYFIRVLDFLFGNVAEGNNYLRWKKEGMRKVTRKLEIQRFRQVCGLMKVIQTNQNKGLICNISSPAAIIPQGAPLKQKTLTLQYKTRGACPDLPVSISCPDLSVSSFWLVVSYTKKAAKINISGSEIVVVVVLIQSHIINTFVTCISSLKIITLACGNIYIHQCSSISISF